MKRRKFLSLLTVGLLSLAAFFFSEARAEEPTIAGTWELNVAASKSTDPMPKSATRVYEVIGNSEKLSGTVVTADGKTIPIGFTATLDGKDSPSQNPGVDTVVLTPVDALTVNYLTKLAGKVMYSGSRVLSRDGKIMTLTANGVNSAGKTVDSVMVFDRR
ncbi:hypothetical protein IVB03_16275 [Bradyrhizobium sp. 168]|jgi:hypothetical protein|uniref:hypothetical protein n=1 Tax=Bradyrhizobium sp. 168 TaxID=2782639 RepID=UPI001FF8E9CE|nr:hypothetical protein [Bradyrhizobium sp. 168]MCK1581094.1 hypothetical protein [Bradyrhizobium sp. 168]